MIAEAISPSRSTGCATDAEKVDIQKVKACHRMAALFALGLSFMGCAHSEDIGEPVATTAQADEKIAEAISATRDCADATSEDGFDAAILTDRGWRGIMQQTGGSTILYAPPGSLDGVSIGAPRRIRNVPNGCILSDYFQDDAFLAKLKSNMSSAFRVSRDGSIRIGRDFVEINEEVRTNARGSRRFFVVSVYEIGDVE